MGIMKETMDQYYEMLTLLASVITEVEESGGEIEAPTYLDIRKFLNDKTPVPENMQKRIEVWEDLYDCKL